MAISTSLRNKLIAAAGGGAMLIATVFLGGKDGVEGRVYVPYKDVVGVWTVCDGITGAGVVQGKHYTDRECDSLLWQRVRQVKAQVDPLVKAPLGEYQRAALYSFTYSVGIESFSKSTLLKRVNVGDQEGACNELRRWVSAGGVKWKGLLNRREMEQSLCLGDFEK
ncbi:lysozyme [Pantoea piersonii]|uniref:lysozyme n=1 Tax=Pantoea piersonii TaxID=2364647 RepID=UPI0022F1A8AE|nr:lysozyme [Pantoea piersonii]WBV20231.1 lysozyme [Pantoea piersonii]